MGKQTDSDKTWIRSIAAGIVTSGGLLVAACIPSAALLAVLAGKPPIASILLLQSDAPLSYFLTNSGHALDYEAYALIAALLGLYGVVSLCAPLLFWVAREAGYLKVLSLSWGMFLGLALTSLWYDRISTPAYSVFQSYTPKIAYLYLAFLLAEGTKASIERHRLSALPYLYAIDGLFGIVAVLVISAGYPPTFADVLLGPLFLVAVACSILIAEWIIVRPSTVLFIALGRTVGDVRFASRIHIAPLQERFSMLRNRLGNEIKSARGHTYRERVLMIDGSISNLFDASGRTKNDEFIVRFDWRLVTGIFFLNLLFPISVGVIGRLIL